MGVSVFPRIAVLFLRGDNLGTLCCGLKKNGREMTSRSRSDVQIMLTASQSGNSVTSAAKPDGAESSFVFDSAIPEAYATVDTAQKEHAKYNSDQVRHPENQQGGVDLLYEFDGIAHSERSVSVTVGGSEGGGSGGGVVNRGVVPEPPSSHSRPRRRYEAANILYEDNELPSDTLKHRSLHAASYSMYPEKDKGSYITCRCKTRTLVVTFFTALAFLLALAALVLSVILWFGVYDSSSSSSPAVTPSGCNCPSEFRFYPTLFLISAHHHKGVSNQSRGIITTYYCKITFIV